MFRRTTTSEKHRRDLGVKFCDGWGVSTQAERGAQRLEDARTAVMSMPVR
jgi:hypothetical protein